MLLVPISGLLTVLLVAAFATALIVVPLFWVASYAQEKGRDPLPWVLLSFFASPLAVLFILWLLPPAGRVGR